MKNVAINNNDDNNIIDNKAARNLDTFSYKFYSYEHTWTLSYFGASHTTLSSCACTLYLL